MGGRLVSGRGLSSVENEVWGARVAHLVRKAAAYGTLADNVRTDMRQVRRRSSRSRAVSFGSIFLSGRRWTPGTVPATQPTLLAGSITTT